METKEIEEKVLIALDEIRPFLESDGGDISLVEVTDEMVVKLEFIGACKSCSMSETTFSIGVQEVLKAAIPEIKAIEVVSLENHTNI